MRLEIVDRLNEIVLNDSNLQFGGGAVFTTFSRTYPAILEDTKLPAIIWLGRQDNGYERAGGRDYRVAPQFDGRVYLSPIGEGLKTIQNIRAQKWPDLFASAFLSRPTLGYNDSGLNGMAGEITFQIASDLARPVEYPIGNRQNLYWGFVIRLTVPFEETIEVVA